MTGPGAEDRMAIYELYARYSWALDTGDADGYVALFTADAEATEETREGTLEVRRGLSEIRRLVRKFHDRPDFPGHQHQMAQFVFEPDPLGRPDHWVVRSYAWATINRPPAAPHLHWCGHVRDVVVKVDGSWRIRSKQIMGWAGEVLSGFAKRVLTAALLIPLAAILTIHGQLARAQAFSAAKSAMANYATADLSPRLNCESLAQQHGNRDIREIHATQIAAAESTPAYCRLNGLLDPEVAFEISLPEHWNGRFYMFGNGGLAGESLEDPFRTAQRNGALQMGFAVAQTNTGHDARKEPGGSFVMSNPRKALDYAYRAVNLTATTAKEMTRHYYGKAVSRSYWNSCSNGGRQGLIEAERYPRDFDGILVNSPWVDQTGFTVGAMWNQKAVSSAALTPAKLALVADKVMAKCDALDGLKDGLIDDPRVCRFDARADVPACPAGEDGESCLTAVEADAMMRVYVGPVSHGKSLFPGFMFGSEAVVPAVFGGGPAASGWMNVIVPAQAGRNSADFNLAEGIMRYLVHTPPQAQYDYREFDFDRDVGTLAAWGKKANATDTDLAAVRHRGGKLIMTYGWADTILQPMMGVDYYKRAVARNGRDTPEFFRLFMVPGMGHCGGGIGTDRFDAMTALIDWAEKGKAPDSIRAARVVDNREVRSRPLCVYPQVARYSGQGSIDEAANFSCVVP